MKKRFIKLSTLLTIFTLLFALTGCDSNSETIVVSTWDYNIDQYEEVVIKPFEEQTGINVELDTGSTGERYSKIAANSNYDVDVVLMSQFNTQKGVDAGLWEDFDTSKLTNYDKLYDNAKDPNGSTAGPAYTYNRMAIVYNKDLVDEEITSFSDVLYSDKVENITIPSIGDSHGPSLIETIGNVNNIDVYTKKGSEKAFEELDKISQRVVKPYTSATDVVQLLESGSVQAALVPEYHFNNIKEVVPNLQWVDPKEGSVLSFNTAQISKTSDSKDASYQFIDYILSDEVQQRTAEAQFDPPVNKNVELDYYIEGIPFTPIDEFNTVNYQKATELTDFWVEQFNKIYAQ